MGKDGAHRHMGITVTAAQAAELAHRHERVVRGWIASGKLRARAAGPRGKITGTHTGPSRWAIDTDDLARVPGVTLDRERLAALEAQAGARGPGSVLTRLDALEREVAQLRRELQMVLARRSAMPDTSGTSGEPITIHPAIRIDVPAPSPAPSPVRYAVAMHTSADHLDSRAQGAEFLVAHGVNSPSTPNGWTGWKQVTLSRRAVLRFAIAWRQQTTRSPGKWQLHRCADPACVCRELLPFSPSSADEREPVPVPASTRAATWDGDASE